MGIMKRILKHLDWMLKKQSLDIQDRFNACMNTFLPDEHIYIWRLGNRIGKYLGDDLKTWGENAGTIAEWIEKENLHKNSKEWKHMCEALKLLPGIKLFMLKAKVDGNYPQEIAAFETNVKEFYSHGAETFLKGADGIEGKLETSYMHLLRFNLGELAQITYDRHKLGIGVFTLQGVSCSTIIFVVDCVFICCLTLLIEYFFFKSISFSSSTKDKTKRAKIFIRNIAMVEIILSTRL